MANIVINESTLDLLAASPLRDARAGATQANKRACYEMEQFKSGAVTRAQIDLWLAGAGTLYGEQQINRLIQRQACFTGDEVVALVSDQRNRYHPKLSTSEVAETKLFNRLPVFDSVEMRKLHFTNEIVRDVIIKRFGLSACPEDERAMQSLGGKIGWLSARPGLVGEAGGTKYVFDFNPDGAEALSKDEKDIRLHHVDLVASNHGIQADEVIMVTCTLSEKMENLINAMASFPGTTFQSIVSVVGSDASLAQGVKLDFDRIAKSPTIYTEVVSAGNHAWQQITSGIIPAPAQEPEIALSRELSDEYTSLAKECYGAMQFRHAAEALEREKKDRMTEFCRQHNITKDFTPPYGGVHMRSHDEFDLNGAARFMVERIGVDRQHIFEPEFDTEALVNAVKRLGGNPRDCMKEGKPDRRMIEDVSVRLGVPIESFYVRSMQPVAPPKTRGAFFETTSEFREVVKEKLDAELHTPVVSKFINHETIESGGIQKRKTSFGPGM